MTTETIDLHYQALSYGYPVINTLILLMNLYGAKRSIRFRPAFSLLAIASLLWIFPQAFEGLLRAQRDFSFEWMPKDTARQFLPYVLLSNWVAIPFHLLGFGILIRLAAKSNEQNT